MAINVRSNSSWSDDMNIMDFGNDDNFRTSWTSNHTVKEPWYELIFEKAVPCNMIVLTSGTTSTATYRLQYYINGKWKDIQATNEGEKKVNIFRFERIWSEKIKVTILQSDKTPSIAELGVFNERT